MTKKTREMMDATHKRFDKTGLKAVDDALPMTPPLKAIFEKQYVADGISDIWRDTSEMLDERMNPAAAEIPKDEHGFHSGTFTLTLTWTPDE